MEEGRIRVNLSCLSFKMRFLAILSALFLQCVVSQVLQPPYFDIAKGKPITATATCGEGPGLEEEGRELFCKLAQAPGRVGIKGQSCDYCYPGNHSIKFSNDGSEKWWQSPSLSRGLQYENVNITINLGQVRFFRFFCGCRDFGSVVVKHEHT